MKITSVNPIVVNALMRGMKVAKNGKYKANDKIGPAAAKFAHLKEDKQDLIASLGGMTFEQAFRENESTGWIKAVENLDSMVRDCVYDALAEYDGSGVSPKTMVKIGNYNNVFENVHAWIIKHSNSDIRDIMEMKNNLKQYINDAKKYLLNNPNAQAKKMLNEIVAVSQRNLSLLK